MNLEHVSHGNGPHRYISISKPTQASNTASSSEEIVLESSSMLLCTCVLYIHSTCTYITGYAKSTC